MYGKTNIVLLSTFILLITGISYFPNIASAAIQFDNTYQLIQLPNGTYSNYRLTQNATAIQLETNEGSYVFNSNTCTLSTFSGGLIGNKSPVFTDSYLVMASNTANGTSGWNPVNLINNAACSAYTVTNSTTVWITGTKTVSGGGTFSVTYMKTPKQNLKVTFSATNNNPSWTNYHLGLREILQHVPGNVTLGDTVYDLSQHNNTGLNRAFISAHNSQLIQFDTKNKYTMGLGWNNANSITDIYHVGNPALQIDYIYNTPILSPGNTITIDPSIVFDSTGTTTTALVSNSATQTVSITVGNNPNRVLVFGLTMNTGSDDHNNRISTVKIGSTSFTLALNKTVTRVAGFITDSEIWYLVNPPTGVNTITITPVKPSIAYDMIANSYSLYDVNQATPIGVTNSSTATQQSVFMNIVPTHANAWILDLIGSIDPSSLTHETGTQGWNANSGPGYYSGSEYNSSPTIGIKNSLQWLLSSSKFWVDVIVEVLQSNFMSPPTLTHANTLNSTAIKLDWPSVSGAQYYLVKRASPVGGAFSQISNQSAITYTDNSLSGGTQYQYEIFAGNSSALSAASNTKSNYTTNIAPTNPVISSITNTGARVTVTNPSGNFSGYLIYQVQGNGVNYTLAGTSSNTTNHFDLSGLNGNTKHTVKLSTRYAVGTNSSGASSNSTTVSFYTLPTAPTALAIVQTKALIANLTWTPPTDNGTVLGYKIERSTTGASWSTISANTGNTIHNYNDTVPNAGKFYYRVSTLKYSGTSSPSSSANKVIWDYFTVNAYHNDNTTAVYGLAIQSNSTSSNNQFTLVSGSTVIPGLSNNNNFTIKNALINFVVKKQYNYNTTANRNINMSTYDFDVDCPSTGTGVDVEVWTNGTNGHNITTFTKPTCFSNNTMKWSTKFTANGNDLNSYNTLVYVKAVNATFGTVAPLKYNQTKVTTAFTDPYIISNGVTVGTGLQTKLFNWSMNLTVSPAFTPVNFTVGHISVSGVNPVTTPIKFTTTTINSSATKVTVTFPSTYTMGYQLTFGNEGSSHIYTGLPVSTSTPSLGLSQSSFTFLNPSKDLVTIKAYDIPSNTTARYVLAQPNNQIPFVTQILNFKNGLFGTSAMIGGIDIVSLIILLIAMIGLNRANETVGAIMMIIIIGVCAYFGLIEWQTTMTAAIALVVLVIVSSTKKLPWS